MNEFARKATNQTFCMQADCDQTAGNLLATEPQQRGALLS
jgi:hypothetical protein